MVPVAAVDIDGVVHRVLIGADQHTGGNGEGDEPFGVCRLDAERTGPDRLLVFQEALWRACEGDRFGGFRGQVIWSGCRLGWDLRLWGLRERTRRYGRRIRILGETGNSCRKYQIQQQIEA